MKAKEKQLSIEYIRLLACLIVVACHVNFFLHDDAAHRFLKTVYFCLFSDGVAVFWMITGCFLFSGTDYLSLWKRVLRRVALPAVCLFILCLALSSWKLPPENFDHTWYIQVYLTVTAMFPLLRRFVDFLDHGKYRDLVFLILSFLLFLFNDLTQNSLLHFGFSPVSGLLPACAQILWGHILYRRLRGARLQQESAPRKKHGVLLSGMVSALLFLLLNLLRAYIQLQLYGNNCDYNLRVWHTSFSLICAACVLAPAAKASAIRSGKPISLSAPRLRLQKLLCGAASYTFGIYLIHPVAAALLKSAGLWKLVQERLFPYGPASACFLAIGTLLLFSLSLGVCFLLRRFTNAAAALLR